MLISAADIHTEEKEDGALTHKVLIPNLAYGHLQESVSPKLGKDCAIQFVSNGHWSMHELLIVLLRHTGAAKVYISSYAFSETPTRQLADLKEEGLITELHCIIDSRVDVRSAGALQLLRNLANSLKLCATHAKVTIIQNENYSYSVVSSANYTTNKRYESGVILENESLATANIEWIMKEIEKDD